MPDPTAFEWRTSTKHRIGPGAGLYYCSDCGRRFANKGWHAEACGSSNYEPVEFRCEVDESAGLKEERE